jgi:hypothetical protein
MKSLSIVVLLGTLSAIVLGAIFAIAPALAGAAPETQSNPVADLPVEQAVAPVTGSAAEDLAAAAPAAVVVDAAETAPQTDVNAEDPGLTLASTFSMTVEKDTASVEAVQEAAAPAASVAQPEGMDLASFAASVAGGDGSQVAGIYVEGLLAYSVVAQPKGNAAFVSEQPGVVTQFGLAAEYGSQAFLAHNYLAGGAFAQLAEGDVITVVYGNGVTASYKVSEIKTFQALSPDSVQSSFVDLASGEKLSNSELFHSIFNGSNSVVLQTCIAQGDVSTWGRLFITAVPLS